MPSNSKWLNSCQNGTGKPAPTWLPQGNRYWPNATAPIPSGDKVLLLNHLKKSGAVKTNPDGSVK